MFLRMNLLDNPGCPSWVVNVMRIKGGVDEGVFTQARIDIFKRRGESIIFFIECLKGVKIFKKGKITGYKPFYVGKRISRINEKTHVFRSATDELN